MLLKQIHQIQKCCFNLNREANYRPQGAFDDRAEEGISVPVVMLSIFTGIPITIYSTIEISVIVLGQPLKI